MLVAVCSVTFYVDPNFHFHKPFTDRFYYSLEEPRYTNDGIVKHFDYDALITGSSMTHNFLASDFDKLFGCSSIKVPFNAATFFETNNVLKNAFKRRSLKYVIRSVDNDYLLRDKDYLLSQADYPEYMYNNNVFDDIKYLLNAKVVERSAKAILKKRQGIDSFDEYCYFSDKFSFGKEFVLKSRNGAKFAAPGSARHLSESDKKMISDNVRQNFVEEALKHPETQFYYFFPPYSIVHWAFVMEEGGIEAFIESEKIAIDLMLQCDNIHLFSFNTEFDMICDLGNYMDAVHYGAWINDKILRWMKDDVHRITKENAGAILSAERDFYSSFDYNSLF